MAHEYTPEELGIKPEKEYTLEELESMQSPESGGIAAAKASVHDIMGQGALTLGKLGLMHPEDAQKSYEEHKQKSEGIFKPTEENWLHAPLTKISELIGGSAPYVAAPIIGGALAEPLGIGALGAGVASAGQFIGSNLSRQLDEGKKEGKTLADTSLTYATLAAIPQAALDTVSLHMIPGIRGIFAKAGQDITEKTAEMIAKKGIANTALDLGKASTVEGLTEAGQQVFERLQAGLNITDEDARKEYYDNFVGGAVLGGVLGAGGHFVEKTMQNKEENKYDSIMNSLRSSFDTGSTVPMTDVVNKVSDLTGEKDLNKIQNFLGGAQDRGHIETVPQPDDTLHIKFKQPTPIEQADEQQKNANPDIYKPEVFDSHADLFKAIVPKLKKFGLEGVGIKIMDNIENGRADGLWANKIIHVAMNSDNPIGTMRHESVHALKELGGFKPNEWTVLTNKAKDEWVDKFIKKPNLYDEYKNQYLKDYGNLDGFDDYIHEEAIAEAFKHFDQTKPPAGLVGNIYYRIKQLFDTVRNGFQGNGFHTSDSIFRSLDEGKRAPVQLTEGQTNEQPKYSRAQYDEEGKPIRETPSLRPSSGGGEGITLNDRTHPNASSFVGHHYSKGERAYLNGSMYGSLDGIRGQEGPRVAQSSDPRIKKRAYFYIPHSLMNGRYIPPEQGLGPFKHTQKFNNILGPGKDMSRIYKESGSTPQNMNPFESQVINEGFDGYAIPHMGMMVVLNHDNIPVTSVGRYSLNKLKNAKFIDSDIQDLVKNIGSRIAGMKSTETLDDVKNAVLKLQSYTEQGYKGKKWYENSAKAVLDAFNGDPILAEKFFQIIAITSGNTEVAANFTKTVKAWSQFASGKPIKVGTADTNRKVSALLNFGDDWAGRKTNTFYTNLMEAMEGKDTGRSTIDLHMARMIFGKDQPTDAQYELAEKMIGLLASKAGMLPRQVQAASWVTQKAKTTYEDYKTQKSKQGIPDKKLKLMALKRALGDYSHQVKSNVKKLTVTPELKESSASIRARTENITGEVIPSVKLPMGQAEELDFKNKEKVTKQVANSGKIQDIADSLNLTSKIQVTIGAGGYESKVNPNLIVKVINPDPNISHAEALQLAKAMSYVFKQDATPMFRADPNFADNAQLGYKFKFDTAELTPTQQKKILNVLQKRFGGDAGFTKINKNELVLINYRGEDGKPFLTPDEDFQNGLVEIADELNKISKIESQDVFGAQSEYPYHDWTEEPAGTSLIEGLQVSEQRRSNLQGRLDSISESFKSDLRKSIESTGRTARFSLKAPDTPAFKRWFGNSKIVNEDGTPKVMYHGTAQDISEFRPKQANAIFVTDNPNFAGGFSDASEIHMAQQIQNKLTSDELFNLHKKSDKIAKKEGTSPVDEFLELVKNKLPSRANIIPVFVRAENPFNYTNGEHLEVIKKELNKKHDDWGRLLGDKNFDLIRYGDWETIESKNVQDAIKKLGFDGFYVKEGGIKNLAVYKPTQLKSATGNQGTFDIKNPDIRYSLKAPDTPAFKRWFSDSLVINEQGKPQIVYTGTSKDKDFTSFNVPKNGAWFTTDPSSASQYAVENDSMGYTYEGWKPVPKNTASRVIPAFLKIENPFQMTNEIFQREIGKEGSYKKQQAIFFDKLRSQGYDGVYMQDGIWVVLNNPNQIKSAFNMNPTENKDMRYSLSRLTKTDTVPTGGERIRQAYDDVSNNIKNDAYWTKLRVEWVDKGAGITKSLGTARVVTSKDQQGNILHKKLEGLPQFDMHGKLRADLLLHAKAQAINLIKNGLLSGNVKVQHDGTLGVERSENNLARSLIEADKLDSAFKPLGLTGRSGIAEVARILRGEDIIKEDNEARLRGVGLLTKAKADRKEAKKLYKDGKFKEAQKMMRQVAKDRSEGYKLKGQNRELEVSEEHIAWAHRTLDRIPEIENVLNIWKEVNRGLVDLWVDTGLLDAETADKFKAQDRYVPLFKSREDLDEEGFFYGTGTGTKTSAKIKKLEGSTATRNIWENIDKHYAKMVSQAYENQSRRIGVDQLKYFGLAEITNRDDPRVNLRYKENGKEISAIVENPNDLAAFQSMQYELSPLMKTFVPMTKALRAGALLNPMYWVKQLIKDSIHGTLVANSGIVTPFHSTKEFVSILAKNSEEAKLLASRGVIGAVDSTLSMNEFLKQAGKEKYDPHAMSNAMHKIMQIHEASDAATRVAIYKKAYQDGLKKFNGDTVKATDFAVFKARESINFSVHGNSPLLNSLRSSIPFFSASITSLDTVYRAMTGHGLNAEEKAQARSIFVKRAAMMAVMSAMYAMLYQDNDEYKKQPDYVKDNNWLVPLPDGKTFVKIPTPFEVGFLFKTIPEASVRYMNGTSTGKEVLASYYAGLLQNLPANGMPVPQAVRPILENITNHSFFTNQPIEGMGDQGLPVAMRGQRATEFSKMLSRNGLDKLNMSPAKIDNLFNGYFAELGTLTTGMATDLTYLAEGKEPPAKNIQNYEGIRQFVTDPNVSKAVSDFYSLEMNAKDMATAVNKMKSEGNIEGLQKIINDEDMKKTYASDAPLRKIGEEMTKLRKAINFYKETQGIDPEERRKRINELTQTYNKIAENGYTISNAIGLNR